MPRTFARTAPRAGPFRSTRSEGWPPLQRSPVLRSPDFQIRETLGGSSETRSRFRGRARCGFGPSAPAHRPLGPEHPRVDLLQARHLSPNLEMFFNVRTSGAAHALPVLGALDEASEVFSKRGDVPFRTQQTRLVLDDDLGDVVVACRYDGHPGRMRLDETVGSSALAVAAGCRHARAEKDVMVEERGPELAVGYKPAPSYHPPELADE